MRVALNFTYVMFATLLLPPMQPDIDAEIIEDFGISLDALIALKGILS